MTLFLKSLSTRNLRGDFHYINTFDCISKVALHKRKYLIIIFLSIIIDCYISDQNFNAYIYLVKKIIINNNYN